MAKRKPFCGLSPVELCAYRASLSCKIGRDVIEGKSRDNLANSRPMEFAVYNLLHAVEDIANALKEMDHGDKK